MKEETIMKEGRVFKRLKDLELLTYPKKEDTLSFSTVRSTAGLMDFLYRATSPEDMIERLNSLIKKLITADDPSFNTNLGLALENICREGLNSIRDQGAILRKDIEKDMERANAERTSIH